MNEALEGLEEEAFLAYVVSVPSDRRWPQRSKFQGKNRSTRRPLTPLNASFEVGPALLPPSKDPAGDAGPVSRLASQKAPQT